MTRPCRRDIGHLDAGRASHAGRATATRARARRPSASDNGHALPRHLPAMPCDRREVHRLNTDDAPLGARGRIVVRLSFTRVGFLIISQREYFQNDK